MNLRRDVKSDTERNTWLLIPAYNVEAYLGRLLQEALLYLTAQTILVVNDGSTDNTAGVAESHHVNLVSHPRNSGKGAALRTGFDYLLGRGAEWVITIDGDLQHDPSRLPDFIEQAELDDHDIIIGTRQRKVGGMPWDRRFSNWATSLILSIVTGQKVSDSQSGYRLIRCRMLKGMEFRCKGYDFETEMLLKLSRVGARIGSIEIPTIYDGAPSTINSVKDTLKFLKVILRFILTKK